MKVVLLKDKNIGLARPRLAGKELDIDPVTAAEWVADGSARYADETLMQQAALEKKTLLFNKSATLTAATPTAPDKN